MVKGNVNQCSSFALPDGQEIEIGVEKFIAPEVMFDPQLLGIRNQYNVVDMLFESCARYKIKQSYISIGRSHYLHIAMV